MLSYRTFSVAVLSSVFPQLHNEYFSNFITIFFTILFTLCCLHHHPVLCSLTEELSNTLLSSPGSSCRPCSPVLRSSFLLSTYSLHLFFKSTLHFANIVLGSLRSARWSPIFAPRHFIYINPTLLQMLFSSFFLLVLCASLQQLWIQRIQISLYSFSLWRVSHLSYSKFLGIACTFFFHHYVNSYCFFF